MIDAAIKSFMYHGVKVKGTAVYLCERGVTAAKGLQHQNSYKQMVSDLLCTSRCQQVSRHTSSDNLPCQKM